MSNFGAVPSEGAIPESALATGTAAVPVGTILDWFPPSSATPPYTSVLPSNWVVCSGQSWTDVNAALATSYGAGTVNDLGFSAGNVPNLVGRVTYGASTAVARDTNAGHTTSTGSQTNAGVGGLVGTNTGVNAKHSHTVGNHQHAMDHWHGVAEHSHPINNKNTGPTSTGYYASLTTSSNLTYVPTSASTNNAASYTGVALNTSLYTERTLTGEAGTTTTSNSGPDTTNDYYQDNRSAGVGVLKIMKVKNIS
jgi:hypothetical protein